MNAGRTKLRLLLDEGVPNSVGRKFEEAGHQVTYVNQSQLVQRGSPDTLVAAAAVANGFILVAHDGDMKQIAKNHGFGGGRYKTLSLIKLTCRKPKAAERVEHFMSLIEHEWEANAGASGRRLFIEIQDNVCKTWR